jgi:DNA-binding NtrC family response regulator
MSFFFGATPGMIELQSKAELIARGPGPVLIEGETGTGKERLASFLHTLRGGRGRLIKLVCDSSGSGAQQLGLIDGPDENTLLLKRIHRLPVPSQERILAAVDEGRESVPLIISTTSERLELLVESGSFVPELFYRVSAYRISTPPLRHRREDIPNLFLQMLAEIQEKCGVAISAPDPAALNTLLRYSWPGNLRELQNVARAYLLAPNPAALEQEIERKQRTTLAGTPNGTPVRLKDQVREASKRFEAEIILRTLERNRWNRRQTAQSLSISYRSLLYKMKYCDIRAARQAAEQ